MPTEATRAKIEAEQAAAEAERRAVESRADRTRSLADQAAQTTADTQRRIDELANSETERPGVRGIR